jgi:hypothetical protein
MSAFRKAEKILQIIEPHIVDVSTNGSNRYTDAGYSDVKKLVGEIHNGTLWFDRFSDLSRKYDLKKLLHNYGHLECKINIYKMMSEYSSVFSCGG